MSSTAKQIRFLNKISWTTRKPQVIISPEKYRALKLTFQYQNHNGHMGARKFWREQLPTLKFYNPDLNIDVIRVKNDNKRDASIPCTLDIVSTHGTVVEQIDMRGKNDEAILDELLSKVEHERVAEEQLVKV